MASREDCTFKLIKMGFIAGNLLAFILSAIAMGVSILFLVNFQPLTALQLHIPKSLLIILVLICILVGMVSFFGWYGGLKESPGLLYLYAGIITIIFLVSLIILIVLATQLDELKKALYGPVYTEGLKVLKSRLEDSSDTSGIDVIGDVEITFKCCGLNDTLKEYWIEGRRAWKFPGTCCGKRNPSETCPKDKIYKKGCLIKIGELWESRKSLIISCYAVSLVFQMVAIVASCGIGKISATKPAVTDYDNYGEYDDY